MNNYVVTLSIDIEAQSVQKAAEEFRYYVDTNRFCVVVAEYTNGGEPVDVVAVDGV